MSAFAHELQLRQAEEALPVFSFWFEILNSTCEEEDLTNHPKQPRADSIKFP